MSSVIRKVWKHIEELPYIEKKIAIAMGATTLLALANVVIMRISRRVCRYIAKYRYLNVSGRAEYAQWVLIYGVSPMAEAYIDQLSQYSIPVMVVDTNQEKLCNLELKYRSRNPIDISHFMPSEKGSIDKMEKLLKIRHIKLFLNCSHDSQTPKKIKGIGGGDIVEVISEDEDGDSEHSGGDSGDSEYSGYSGYINIEKNICEEVIPEIIISNLVGINMKHFGGGIMVQVVGAYNTSPRGFRGLLHRFTYTLGVHTHTYSSKIATQHVHIQDTHRHLLANYSLATLGASSCVRLTKWYQLPTHCPFKTNPTYLLDKL